jgi:hypothetical protein
MNMIMRKIAQTDEIPHSNRSNSMVRPLMSWVADLRSDRPALFGFMLITPRKKGGVVGGGSSLFTLPTRR